MDMGNGGAGVNGVRFRKVKLQAAGCLRTAGTATSVRCCFGDSLRKTWHSQKVIYREAAGSVARPRGILNLYCALLQAVAYISSVSTALVYGIYYITLQCVNPSSNIIVYQ